MNELYVVGLGPGDPDLITVKGYKILMDADLIYYPYTSFKYAENILISLGIDKKKMQPLEFPIRSLDLLKKIRENACRIKNSLEFYDSVVYAVEGDPMLYSTFLDLYRYLDCKVRFIPGISSINAAAAILGIPMAEKDEIFTIIPAVNDYEYMKKMIMGTKNGAIIKAIGAKDVLKKLLDDEHLKKYYIMENVSLKSQKIYNNINDIDSYMALVILK
ncbi:precorrin-2 C(20)-methyltransferase [Acidiplasma sp.]|uniref:precorrin-2 C(20)-methyltransferase n=1 Tax=Acidiplasma sp. TaxID=1872114 RepID=UPI00258710B9|nr:precorrin-2 C(20)-methyltransferase [Acidiplasma sp.]